ncbi:hypothetical protein HYPSUDRAFT_651682 [Hypholoma sublateritium FD-334 SS-4]|uniref:Uncharacterized protein n=1 Tax=Hypholoma sublateritium (strain FD-334 SS-4) TaxID=945553 RepID=A0A0D2P1C9_HYPSF|nr:hypothetical protein HYPSUDRAFT_651682 [Hypholoma sublateritium FD-334 SS-4]
MLFPDACPPLYRYTDPNVLQVEKQMFGIISSAMAYGAVVLLFGDCCNHLLKTRHISSRQTRIQLFIFSLSMTLLSTGALRPCLQRQAKECLPCTSLIWAYL